MKNLPDEQHRHHHRDDPVLRFFSGMEIAFLTSNKLHIELEKGRGLLSARILSHFYKIPSQLIGTLLIGNNIALVIYGIAMANVIDPLLQSALPEHLHSGILILLIQTIMATLVILFLGEFLPKALFRLNANGIVRFFAVPLWLMYYLLYPIVYIFTGLSQFILSKFMGMRFTRQEPVFTSVDLDQYLQELAKDEEQIEDVQQEIQMFQNMIGFRKVKLQGDNGPQE